jgi:hypothetical protein
MAVIAKGCKLGFTDARGLLGARLTDKGLAQCLGVWFLRS